MFAPVRTLARRAVGVAAPLPLIKFSVPVERTANASLSSLGGGSIPCSSPSSSLLVSVLSTVGIRSFVNAVVATVVAVHYAVVATVVAVLLSDPRCCPPPNPFLRLSVPASPPVFFCVFRSRLACIPRHPIVPAEVYWPGVLRIVRRRRSRRQSSITASYQGVGGCPFRRIVGLARSRGGFCDDNQLVRYILLGSSSVKGGIFVWIGICRR